MYNTDMPMIGKVGELIRSVKAEQGNVSIDTLVQGVVHWGPPKSATAALVQEAPQNPDVHRYCEHDFGTFVLRSALLEKLETENYLKEHSVIVTAGANQGFASIVNACCDPDDEAVIFAPYYFNHMMALQMSNVKPLVVQTRVENGYLPVKEDFDVLQEQIDAGQRKIRMIVVCNPCNPTGAVFPESLLERISQFCRKNHIWMICDETYEYFVFNDDEGATENKHYTPVGSHIIHLYSFSKAYGLMGWRVGYIAFDAMENPDLTVHLHKFQDTVPISCGVPSQFMALMALKEGKPYAMSQINTLIKNREYVWEVMKHYPNTVKTFGAMYLFAQFPNFVGRGNVTVEEEWKVIQWLVRKHRVAVLPGSAFGVNGYFRVSYANLSNEQCKKAAESMSRALQELASGNFDLDS